MEKKQIEVLENGNVRVTIPLIFKIVDHFFIFQKNSLQLKMAKFSSLKRRSIFTSRKILREKLELHSASKRV